MGWNEEDGDKETITENVTELLTDKDRVNMLDEYFSLEINEDGELVSIPLLLEGFVVIFKDKKFFNNFVCQIIFFFSARFKSASSVYSKIGNRSKLGR